MGKDPHSSCLKRFKQTALVAARIARDDGIRSLLAQSMEKIQKRKFSVTGPSVPDADYATWIAKNEPDEIEFARQREKASKFSYRPLVSILTPVWNPPLELFNQTMDSVFSQTYDNWELCMTDGNSNSSVKAVLNSLIVRDHRVKVRFLTSNQGISLNSNAAIQLSEGEFIALLDHDDMLAPSALFDVVACLNENSELDYIYSDMDHMTAGGKRTDPFFKPSWSPDMMLCNNYATHLSVIRSALLKDIGGFRPETDGAQDWDIILRISEKTSEIHHIPKVLYHWRWSPSSVLSGIHVKPYVKKSQLFTLAQYLDRNQMKGTLHRDISGFPKIIWDFDRSTLVTIIIFDDSTQDTLSRCIRSIVKKSPNQNLEIIIVSSNGEQVDINPRNQRIRILDSSAPLDFPSANNLAAAHANGEILVFLNPRTEVVTANWLQELSGWCSQPSVGVAGPQLVSTDKRIIHGGVVIGLPGYLFQGAPTRFRSLLGHTEWYRNCSAVSGACLATRRSLFLQVGQFDERFTASADVEFCIRARKLNYRVVLTPQAKLLLHNSGKMVCDERNQLRELVIGEDPYFNPNLSYDSTIPVLKADP